MKIHDIMKISGYSKEQLAAKFGIPMPTLKSWIYEQRRPPEWVLSMLTYIILLEKEAEHYGKIEKLGAGISGAGEGSSKTCQES